MANRRQLAALLFALILAAAIAAGVVALGSRGSELVLEVTRRTPAFSPGRSSAVQRATIRFFVRESDPAARIEIVDLDEDLVRTIDSSIPLTADEPVVVHWNGRTDAGLPAPSASYRIRVTLPGEDRDMVWPRRIELHR